MLQQNVLMRIKMHVLSSSLTRAKGRMCVSSKKGANLYQTFKLPIRFSRKRHVSE